ncbi:T9SS type A sorting domain-containing protein [uncultured Polaribacter sp.]|uniref:T9SS type A sorting domain-containing protein n=1 Tax=uncultured Polaribacter sp. TaxID=174711 RepID=UPI002612AEE0|nr:T9SS type A sorting domain-containing protein [uncultured Polaribacter sp.]
MKKNVRITVIISFLFFTFLSFSQEDLLAWKTATTPNLPEYPSSFSAAGVENSTVIRGEGLRLPDEERLFGIFAASGFTSAREDAFREGDYFEFEIAPTNGNQINLSGLRAKFRRNAAGPREFLWQFKIDSDCSFTDIESSFRFTKENDVRDDPNGNLLPEIDLSAIPRLQNVAFPNKVIIRLYAWDVTPTDSNDAPETFGFGRNPRSEDSINVKGSVSPSTGPGETLLPNIWNGSSWSIGTAPIPGSQPIRPVIIDGDYDTQQGNIVACSLVVNENGSLTVSNQTFVEVFNDVEVNGSLIVNTQANFVQNNVSGTFNVGATGNAIVQKESSIKKEWFHYTYWSSPVKSKTVGEAFPNVSSSRRFLFNAANYLDEDGDGIDDNADAWTIAVANEVMQPAKGYIATSPNTNDFPRRDIINFSGEYNTGDITTDIFFNANNITPSWNLVGNPYPGALDFDVLYAQNSDVIGGVVYLWSQSLPPEANNPGNAALNFNRDDYAIYNVGVGGVVGASNIRPDNFIPSGQSFFIEGLKTDQITYNNSMRVTDITSNVKFFKTSAKQIKSKKLENKIWLNLASENGIFNQILIGYVKGATNGLDGSFYDASGISEGDFTVLYSKIKDSDTDYAIQGRKLDDLRLDNIKEDVVDLGFRVVANDKEKVFNIAIADIEGFFLKTNNVYLKDKLLNITHNLSESSYKFTSNEGEFNNRFQLTFQNDAGTVLSIDESILNTNKITVSYLKDNQLKLSTNNNLEIIEVNLYNILSKKVKQIKDNNQNKIIDLSNLKQGLYIITAKLSDGSVVNKKVIR